MNGTEVYEAAIENGQTYHSVEVTSTTRGYTWGVKVAGTDLEEIKKRLMETEAFCKEKFGTEKDG